MQISEHLPTTHPHFIWWLYNAYSVFEIKFFLLSHETLIGHNVLTYILCSGLLVKNLARWNKSVCYDCNNMKLKDLVKMTERCCLNKPPQTLGVACLSFHLFVLQVLTGRWDRLGHSAGQSGLWVDAALHADCAGEGRRRGGDDGQDPCQRVGCQRQHAAVPERGIRGLAERERTGCPAGGTNQGVFKTCTHGVLKETYEAKSTHLLLDSKALLFMAAVKYPINIHLWP